MKTRRQKVFAILAACLLCASFFAVPVSALDQMEIFDIRNQIYNYGMGPGGNYDPNYKPFSSLKYVNGEDDLEVLDYFYSDEFDTPEVFTDTGKMTFNLQLDDDFGLLNYYINDLPTGLSFSDNDTFFIESGRLLLMLDNDNFSLSQCRFVIRSSADNDSFDFGEVVAATDILEIDFTSKNKFLSYPQLFFKIIQNTKPSDDLCLCVEFYATLQGDDIGKITFSVSDFTVKFGVGKSPDYPIYPAPDSGNMGSLDSTESQLQDSASAGLNESAELFGSLSTNLNGFGSSIMRVTRLMISLGDKIPYLKLIVNISLALGLFASLLGLAGSIVSAADRKAGREAARAARQAQNERLARAIERSRK